jgi:hypothetical protein
MQLRISRWVFPVVYRKLNARVILALTTRVLQRVRTEAATTVSHVWVWCRSYKHGAEMVDSC